MTPRQLAIAAAADTKWILNSAALLKCRVRHTTGDARWWGLLRLLTESLGLSLKPAADAATRCLRENKFGPRISVIADPSGSASIVVDLGRYQSAFLGNLSRALVLETPKRRGRPSRPLKGGKVTSVQSALRHGVDIGLIQAALRRTPAQRLEMLESNARFIRELGRRRK